MNITFIEVISIISIFCTIVPITYLLQRRQIYKNYYSKIWKSQRSLKPSDLLTERPFEPYYKEREIDAEIIHAFTEQKHILIKGPPLSGKTRAIYEFLKKNETPIDVLIPKCREIDADSLVLPHHVRSWRTGIVILDDLHRFVTKKGFDLLLKEVINKKYIIIASSRTGSYFKLVESKFAEYGIDLYSLFGKNQCVIFPIDEKTAREVAANTQRDWNDVSKSFNGTIGSIFMKLEEMRIRFNNASYEEKEILRTMQKMYRWGIYKDPGIFPIEWVRKNISFDDSTWARSIEALQLKELVTVVKDQLKIETVYFDEVIKPFLEIETLSVGRELANNFENDPLILFDIGKHLQDISDNNPAEVDFSKEVIRIYKKVLKSNAISPYDYALTQNNLGGALISLAEYEDKEENCKRAIEAFSRSLKIYQIDRYPTEFARSQHNLGTVYLILAKIRDSGENSGKAIQAFEEALKIYGINRPSYDTFEQNPLIYKTLDKIEENSFEVKVAVLTYNESHNIYLVNRFSEEYANTQVGLGKAFAILASVDHPVLNYRKAIIAYNEALKIKINRFPPFRWAGVRHDLGITYCLLAENDGNYENIKRAIVEFRQALKVFTIDQYPDNYAFTQHSLALAYENLSDFEDNAGNCKKAIEAYHNCLRIYTIEHFPTDYAQIQNNLGTVYSALAKIEEKSKNCKNAISAYYNALGVFTVDQFPNEYSQLQINLGNDYSALAEIEERSENCKRAISAYFKALEVFTVNQFPNKYAVIQNNLGKTWGTLAYVEKTLENCKKAIDACDKALQIFTIDKFPEDYAMTQNNLGNAFLRISGVDNKAKNCKMAIEAYSESLKIYTIDAYPIEYATVQNGLGTTYGILAEIEEKLKNYRNSYTALSNSLKILISHPDLQISSYLIPIIKRNLEIIKEECRQLHDS